jgi:peptide deformylase
MVRKIVTDRKELSRKTQEVTDKKELRDILEDLLDTIKEHKTAVGLSANQIGYDKAVSIIRLGAKKDKDGNLTEDYTFKMNLVNPKILERNGKVRVTEQCLSFGNITVITDRSTTILLENEEDGERKKLFVQGFEAIVVQHEVDHLNGLTIFNRKHKATN